MPKNLLTVFGATGNQGSSLIRHVLADPTLSSQYAIRAVTRNPTSPAAQSLQAASGGPLEIVQGDLSSPASITAALKDTHTVFLVTLSAWSAPASEMISTEFHQAKTVADAAVTAGVSYLIFSSTVSPSDLSGGKIAQARHLDAKAEIEAYIRGLSSSSSSATTSGMKSAFFHPGYFMQNYASSLHPQPLGDGTFGLFNFVHPETKFPVIDIVADTGKFVGAILAAPDEFEGKIMSAATCLMSQGQVVEVMSKVSGKEVKYVQIPREKMEGFMPAAVGPPMCDMFLWMQDFGYFGPGTEEKVEWTVGEARGRLTSLEEYFEREPLGL